LKLANEWSFVEVKNLAIRELEKLEIEPIERVCIYHRYDIDRGYLVTSYAAICTRPGTLNLSEGRRLGLETSLQIAEARERIRAVASERSGTRSPTFADFTPEDVDTIVREVFEVHVRSSPLTGGGRPSPTSGSSSAANGSHSRSSSGAWPPAQTPGTPTTAPTSQQQQPPRQTIVTPATPPPPHPQPQNQQRQQRQQDPNQQNPFSLSFSPSPQSPVASRPSSTGFWGAVTAFGIGPQSPANGSDPKAEEQSPLNGAGSPFLSGPGEPSLTSVTASLISQ
jgi:hypothetical protein